MYKKILVLLDGSEPSNVDLEHALKLSACKGNHNTGPGNIEITILYVIPELSTSIDY